MSSKISDYELAKAALATVSGVSLRPAGRRLCGLSHQRVKDLRGAIEDYEAGKIESFPEMQQDTRDKLTEALRRHSSGGTAPAGTGVQPKGAGSRADLTRYVDAIIATDGPPEVRAWQISELGALYRSYALAKEADAADRRARAVLLEARARREAVRQAVGGPDRHAAALLREQAQQPAQDPAPARSGRAAG